MLLALTDSVAITWGDLIILLVVIVLVGAAVTLWRRH